MPARGDPGRPLMAAEPRPRALRRWHWLAILMLAVLTGMGWHASGTALGSAAAVAIPTYSWYQQHPAISPRITGAGLAEDPVRQQVVLFGGVVQTGTNDWASSNDTWIWDEVGATWSKRNPAERPPYLYEVVMAYDGRDVLAYGLHIVDPRSTTSCGDYQTWLWNGSTWRQAATSSGPRIYWGAGLAYDPRNGGSALLFGGRGCVAEDGFLDDTWIFDWQTESWHKQTPSSHPPRTADVVMAYDGQNVVLYGGEYRTRNPADATTWTWDGHTWSSFKPLVSPPVMTRSAMAYDLSIGEVVLYGGYDVVTSYSAQRPETWTWNGRTHLWTLRPATSVSPTPRAWAHMASTTATGGVILYGGWADSASTLRPIDYYDTWTSVPPPGLNVPEPTSTSLRSSANPAAASAPVTFTATVAAALGGAPATGAVTFVDGAMTMGNGGLDGRGAATFTRADLSTGSHSITAVYGGDGSHLASTSAPLVQVILGATGHPPPSIQQVTPPCALPGVPASVTIVGTALGGGAVSFSGWRASDASADVAGDQLTVTLPAHGEAVVTVAVSTPYGAASIPFTYSARCRPSFQQAGGDSLKALVVSRGLLPGGGADGSKAGGGPPSTSGGRPVPPSGALGSVPVQAPFSVPVVHPGAVPNPGLVMREEPEKATEAAAETVHLMVGRGDDATSAGVAAAGLCLVVLGGSCAWSGGRRRVVVPAPRRA